MDGLFNDMVTVLRAGGLKVVIFVDDHHPAHVHVFGNGQAKINLLGADGMVALVWASGMTRSNIRRAVTLVAAYQDHLRARWEDMHGPID